VDEEGMRNEGGRRMAKILEREEIKSGSKIRGRSVTGKNRVEKGVKGVK
jgi:hypothetical protein